MKSEGLQEQEKELFEAVLAGDTEAVTKLLAAQVNPNAKNAAGGTPLMIAAYHDYLSIIRLLLGKGATVDDQDKSGMSALAWALKGSNIKAAIALLNAGASFVHIQSVLRIFRSDPPNIMDFETARRVLTKAMEFYGEPLAQPKAVSELLRGLIDSFKGVFKDTENSDLRAINVEQILSAIDFSQMTEAQTTELLLVVSRQFHKLRNLTLTGLKYAPGLVGLIKANPSLVKVALFGCGLDVIGVRQVAQRLSKRYKAVLLLSQCSKVSFAELIVVDRECGSSVIGVLGKDAFESKQYMIGTLNLKTLVEEYIKDEWLLDKALTLPGAIYPSLLKDIIKCGNKVLLKLLIKRGIGRELLYMQDRYGKYSAIELAIRSDLDIALMLEGWDKSGPGSYLPESVCKRLHAALKANRKAEEGSTDTRSKNASDPGEAMLAESALGDDRSLATHGADPHYWYSMANGTALLTAMRESRLTYRGVAIPGQEHSVLRENTQRVFLANPYHAGNFVESIRDDITRIVDGYGENPESKRWREMPRLVVIPLLAERHWRVIRIKIDYESRQSSILWDDPRGAKAFPLDLRAAVLPSILESITTLIRKQTQDDTFVMTSEFVMQQEKEMVQQPEVNNWDCGPIAFDNVDAYLRQHDQETISYNIDQSSDIQAVRSRDRCIYISLQGQDKAAVTAATLTYGIGGGASSAPPPPPPSDEPQYYGTGDCDGKPFVPSSVIVGNAIPFNGTEEIVRLSV